MKTAYQNVSDMNTAFGNKLGLVMVDGKLKDDTSKLSSQAKNLYDELDELRDDGFNVLAKDPDSVEGRKEMFDAIGDILVFLYGVGHFIALDPEKHIIQDYKEYDSHLAPYISQITDEDLYESIKYHIDNMMDHIKNRSLDGVIESLHQIDDLTQSIFYFYVKPEKTIHLLIDRIVESNLSKLCKDEDELNATLKSYRDKGVEVYAGESPLLQENGKPYLVVFSAKEQTVAEYSEKEKKMINKVYRKDKFLKCVNWFEPNLYDF